MVNQFSRRRTDVQTYERTDGGAGAVLDLTVPPNGIDGRAAVVIGI